MRKITLTILLSIIILSNSYAQNFEWAKRMGGLPYNMGFSIATDNLGNIYTTGYFFGTADFDPGSGVYNLTSVGSRDTFIQKLDANGNFIWAKRMGGIYYDCGLSITIDDIGNVYTTGHFFDSGVDFDPGSGIYNLTSAGGFDIFIQKLNADGSFIWARRMGGIYDDEAYSITVDGSGNIYTTGMFSGAVDFDPGSGVYNLTSAGYDDIFIQKLDVNGNFIWAKRMGGAYYDKGKAIVIDSLGNIYSTGSFGSTVDFNPGSGIYNLTSAGMGDVFIQKLDSNGSFIWVKRMGGYAIDNGYSIAIDGLGNVFSTGFFINVVDFDPGSGVYNLTSVGYEDIFIQKLDANGNFIWAKSMGGISSDYAYSIALDDTGNVYTTGCFEDTIDFNPGNGTYSMASTGWKDIFIQKLDFNGNFIWAKQMGGTAGDNAHSIVIDASKNIYTTGYFAGIADFDPGSGIYNLTSAGGVEIFIQKLSQKTTGFEMGEISSGNLSMIIYPNPSKGNFTLEINSINSKSQAYQLEVYSAMGKLIHKEKLSFSTSLKKQMNLETLSKGVYFLRLLGEDNVVTTRFIVE